MNLTLVLPWFPIVLGVGVGARLLDRPRGVGLGILGAVFWVIVIQASAGPGVFQQVWTLAALVSGAAAIVAIGTWSAQPAGAWRGEPEARRPQPVSLTERTTGPDQRFGAILSRFIDWLEVHRYSSDPWPEFGELVRVLLHDLCGAVHVHPYRILREDEVLVPLRAYGPGDTPEFVCARQGVVGHVATSGRSYVVGDPNQGELVKRLADESDEELAWCFAITQGQYRIGLVRVGRLLDGESVDPSRLATAERLVSLFWLTLGEVRRSEVARSRDPASGLLTREPFLVAADRVLAAAYAHNEPVAVAVFGLEGMRNMCDRGDWVLADKLISEASAFLLERVRAEDCIGRFDDSRFVLLLRRVDSALGRLIAEQLLTKLSDLCGDEQRWSGSHTVRCGLVGSGTDQPALADLVSRAVTKCSDARRAGVRMACDLALPASASAGAAAGPLREAT